MRVVLIEFIDEAELLIKRFGKDFLRSSQVKIVCLHPKVRAYLKGLGIESESTHPYFNNDAQHRIILSSEEWMLKLVSKITIVDHFGIEAGYRETLIHHLRLYMNHFLWIIEILKGVCREHEVQEIIACIPKDLDRMFGENGYIMDGERFLGFLARDYAGTFQIPFQGVELVEKKASLINRGMLFLATLAAKIMARLDYRYAISHIKESDEVIIVPGLSYRMDLLLKEIGKNHSNMKCFMIWEGGSSFKQVLYAGYLTVTNWKKKLQKKSDLESAFPLNLLKGARRRNKQQQAMINQKFDEWLEVIRQKFAQEFIYDQIPIAPYLTRKIHRGLREEILNLQHLTDLLSDIFKAVHPRLLMSMYSVHVYYMMGELANYFNFKALNISHGTHVPPNNRFEEIENYRLAASVITNTYPYVAVQTPWTAKFLEHYKDERVKINTGPLLFSVTNQKDRAELREELFKQKLQRKVILYATTQKHRSGFRFHITETLDEYLLALEDIIHSVNRLDHVHLIIRPHPSCDLSDEEFRLMLPTCERLSIVKKGVFSRVLSAADLLVSYSSTCIEEAIQNKIPVLLYDRWRRYNHFNLAETTQWDKIAMKPAYYLTESGNLSVAIEKVLRCFDGRQIEDCDLGEYKFPVQYRSRFFEFVDQALEKEALNGI